MSTRIIKQSDLTGWYTTLNAIRSKNGLSSITAATFSGIEPIAYNKITGLINQVNALKSNAYLKQATYSDFSDIKSGGPVSLETVTDLENTFTSLKQISPLGFLSSSAPSSSKISTSASIICKNLSMPVIPR